VARRYRQIKACSRKYILFKTALEISRAVFLCSNSTNKKTTFFLQKVVFCPIGKPIRRLVPNYFFLGAAFGAAFLPAFAGEGFAAGFPADFACVISIEFKINLR
jgi:hypothetical protein